jgi:hypothetical protein
MNTYECYVRIVVNGNTMDIRTQIRAPSPYEAEQLLKAQYGEHCLLGSPLTID